MWIGRFQLQSLIFHVRNAGSQRNLWRERDVKLPRRYCMTSCHWEALIKQYALYGKSIRISVGGCTCRMHFLWTHPHSIVHIEALLTSVDPLNTPTLIHPEHTLFPSGHPLYTSNHPNSLFFTHFCDNRSALILPLALPVEQPSWE